MQAPSLKAVFVLPSNVEMLRLQCITLKCWNVEMFLHPWNVEFGFFNLERLNKFKCWKIMRAAHVDRLKSWKSESYFYSKSYCKPEYFNIPTFQHFRVVHFNLNISTIQHFPYYPSSFIESRLCTTLKSWNVEMLRMQCITLKCWNVEMFLQPWNVELLKMLTIGHTWSPPTRAAPRTLMTGMTTLGFRLLGFGFSVSARHTC